MMYRWAAFSALITFAKMKSANALPLLNVAPAGMGGPKIGTSLLRDTATLYWVFSVHGFIAFTIINTCWNCDRILRGLKGSAPGSWSNKLKNRHYYTFKIEFQLFISIQLLFFQFNTRRTDILYYLKGPMGQICPFMF